MRQPINSKSLGSATDLTLVAPLREGMAQDGWEAISLRARAVAILRVVNGLRAAREERQASVYADPVERIELIHSFRVALTREQKPKLVLAVAFDFHWEPYIRVIWRDLGPLLDPILIHCEGYRPAVDVPFETYEQWVRQNQIPTEWFYNSSQLTVPDLTYLTEVERTVRDSRDAREAGSSVARLRAPTPDEALRAARETGSVGVPEVNRQAASALGAFHSLTRFFGRTPRRDALGSANDAALLHMLASSVLSLADLEMLPDVDRKLLADALDWIRQPPIARRPMAPPAPMDRKSVPKGILSGFGKGAAAADHGVLLLCEVLDAAGSAAAARAWIAEQPWSSEVDADGPGHVWRQFALARAGLERLGLKPAIAAGFPAEFLQGATIRSPQLGDQRGYHWRNWVHPRANWPTDIGGRVRPDDVDFTIQLRVRAPDTAASGFDHRHPLWDAVHAIDKTATGFRIRAVIPMLSANDPGRDRPGSDHFGLRDGISQPEPVDEVSGGPESFWSDRVPLGELLVGRTDARGNHIAADAFRQDGSFLVVRRMRQYVGRFDRMVRSGMAQTKGSRDQVIGKLLGRMPDGAPLADNAGENDFTFQADPSGERCPLQSHVRRANPREGTGKDAPPRLMRRGMSYGPRVGAPDDEERGLMFMAYCSSIGEQYEVVQRWVNGGNSTRIASFHTDPLMGVPRRGDQRTFRYPERDQKTVFRIDLNRDDRPPVELEWTAYFFVPSLAVVKSLDSHAETGAEREARLRADLEKARSAGEDLLKRLPREATTVPGAAGQAWQAVLDDRGAREGGATAALLAAVARNGGAVRCPYGRDDAMSVIVADAAATVALLDPALEQDGKRRVTVSGYEDRARQSMGRIYLGLDANRKDMAYEAESRQANAAICAIGFPLAFRLGVMAGRGALDQILPFMRPGLGVSLTGYIDAALAILCRIYFDVPDIRGPIEAGGLDFRPVRDALGGEGRPPFCPGDYISPSRYLFDPTPSAYGEEIGKRHGQALAAHTKALDEAGLHWRGLISRPLKAAIPGDPDLYARTHVGIMMGFLPTTFGTLAEVFHEWIDTGAIWRHQSALHAAPDFQQFLDGHSPLNDDSAAMLVQAEVAQHPPCPPDEDPAHERAGWPAAAGPAWTLWAPMCATMQRRPAPDFIWRTADCDQQIGGTEAKAGDILALSILARTLALQADGSLDVFPIFGGDRDQPNHPTHACPGYRMAMGTLLGLTYALLADCVLRPATGPLTLELARRTL